MSEILGSRVAKDKFERLDLGKAGGRSRPSVSVRLLLKITFARNERSVKKVLHVDE